jgi:hypothetical protein
MMHPASNESHVAEPPGHDDGGAWTAAAQGARPWRAGLRGLMPV